jgi:predicted RNase H-like HicB family nuclease
MSGAAMTHYIALVEEEEGKAVGVWFPDLPGCFSAGDTLDEAMLHAREAVALYAESLSYDGRVCRALER